MGNGAPRSRPRSGKKAVNLSVSADLLERARALDVNLSRALEEALSRIVRERQRSVWRERNREAIEEYNRRMERGGPFSEGLRRF